MLRRVLIANRGEIALRVARACRDLGIETVAVYSEADRDSAHVRFCDRAFLIGPGPANRSYLSVPSLLQAARALKADAVHPGYGFLSENAAFARAVQAEGLTFVGPPADAIDRMGDKAVARRIAAEAGLPVVPGGELLDEADLQRQVGAMAFPILLKAAAGGGGRGMRIVEQPGDALSMYRQACAEASAAFGSGVLYWERYIRRARHIEVQVMADAHGTVVDLGERDCSVQRRHQKLVEEAPSPVLGDELRVGLLAHARRLCAAIGYVNAGTVEFIYDEDERRCYFIEMNTRIQVEHPVTEAVTGLDLVAQQLRIAGGEALPDRFTDRRVTGHAIECRINAEDPEADFRPGPGQVTRFLPPGGFGVRVDTHVGAGTTVPPYYDSLLAKLIVHGPDRDAAIRRMRRALDEFVIEGVPSTIAFHRRLMDHPDYIAGRIDTAWVGREAAARAGVAGEVRAAPPP